MKRAFLIAVFAATLAGCQTFNPFASFSNPLGNATLAGAYDAYGIGLSAAVAYRDLCVKKVIANSCRTTVVRLQTADKYASTAIANARAFVKNNPTVDATAIVSTAYNAAVDFKSLAETAKGN